MRPRLLDLFCGAGGAGMGYHRAGFDVVGVDIAPQPHYPFEFVQADAMTYPLDGFDAIHASPPCQDHSMLSHTMANKHGTGWMLEATLDRLRASLLPFVVENVVSPTAKAAMTGYFTLCARSFGIERLRRHRLFVTSFAVLIPECGCDGKNVIGVYGDLSKNDRQIRNSNDGYIRWRAGVQTARDLLGCPWMTGPELTQAIPPAYTEYLGQFLLAAVDVAA